LKNDRNIFLKALDVKIKYNKSKEKQKMKTIKRIKIK
jgi:hypothetical protein